jgi:hypothetical protein
MGNFKRYLEALADFGFEAKPAEPVGRPEMENPINTFNIEQMRDILIERELGPFRPFSRFVNEVQWGYNPGAIRLWVDPKSGVYMDRLGNDLDGTPRWYTNRFYQINRHGYGGYEEVVTQELFDHLEKIQESPNDSPMAGFDGMFDLIRSLTERLRREAKSIFIFDRVQKMHENRYLVCFNLRGQGVQAPQQKRIEKNITDINYYPEGGYLRAINYNYESPLGEHKWEVSGPDIDIVFFPTQPKDEIIDPIVTNLAFY